jgi:hypothetical protein
MYRQQATINTNKTTTMTNTNKYRNSALFLEQKRLAVQKNLRQLQESSISRDVIRSKIIILLYALSILFFYFNIFFFEKVSKQNIIRMKTIELIVFQQLHFLMTDYVNVAVLLTKNWITFQRYHQQLRLW